MPFFSAKRILNVRDWDGQVPAFCAESELNLESCAFNIVSVKTFFVRNDEEVSKDFFKEAYHRSVDLLYQVYAVDVVAREYDFSKLRVVVSDDYLEAVLIFEQGFFVDVESMYKNCLFNHVLCSLIQDKILISSPAEIRSRLDKIISGLNPPCVLLEDKRFLLLKSKAQYRPKGFTNLLEEKWIKDNNKPPFASAMYAVNSGDPVGFFLKEPFFVNGRNLKGEFVDMSLLGDTGAELQGVVDKKVDQKDATSGNVKPSKRYAAPPEVIGESLKVTEEGNVVKYEANGNGYLVFKDSSIELVDIATFEQVGVNMTGCMLGGVEKQCEVDIECHDSSKDAVLNGTVLEADVLNIKGNIGENTVIRANRLSIKGQTHQSSVIYAEKAFISIHKGTLYSDEADIEMLEAGVVNASYANVLELHGGKVVANKVVVSRLHSHSQVDFCEKLHLKIIEGGDNKLNFDIFADVQSRSIMMAFVKRNDFLKSCVQSRVEYYKSLADRLHKIKPVVDNLKPIVAKSRSEGFPLDKGVKKTISYYVWLLKQIKEHKDAAMLLQQSRIENARKAKDLERALESAKITTESSWRDNNQVMFTRRFPSDAVNSIFMQDSDMYDILIDDSGQLQTVDQE